MTTNLVQRAGAVLRAAISCQHIGKDGDKLVTLWNAEHPDDLVE